MCVSTGSEQNHRLDAGTRKTILSALRARDLRLTEQREAVCEAVFGCPGHICAEHIQETVAASHPALKMNKTTVYRTLYLLMELGLVSEHRCGDGRAQYEPAMRGHHSHLICRGCGRMLDMDDDLALSIAAETSRRHGFRVELESYPLLGWCPDCRA